MITVETALTQQHAYLRERFIRELPEVGPHYAALTPDQIREGATASVDALVRAIVEHNYDIHRRRWFEVAQMRAGMGFPVEEVQAAATRLRWIVYDLLHQVYGSDAAGELLAVKAVEECFHRGSLAIAESFDRFYASQQRQLEHAMSELSAPIVPIHEGILVLPLIGSIDSRRATLIMETLLEAINRTGTRVVILDITGVPVVDTGVANYLIQATRAARLLGAEVVLSGISPTIAQTVVTLGVDLSGIVTRADLSAGLEYALQQLGLAIVPLEPANGARNGKVAAAPA